MSFVARLISDGRITIPREVREVLSLQDDSFVICNIQAQLDGPRGEADLSTRPPQLHRIRSILALCAQGANEDELTRGTGLGRTRLTGYIDFLVAEGLLRPRSRRAGETFEATAEGLELIGRMRE
jgi:predicted transcriptional regulator